MALIFVLQLLSSTMKLTASLCGLLYSIPLDFIYLVIIKYGVHFPAKSKIPIASPAGLPAFDVRL